MKLKKYLHGHINISNCLVWAYEWNSCIIYSIYVIKSGCIKYNTHLCELYFFFRFCLKASIKNTFWDNYFKLARLFQFYVKIQANIVFIYSSHCKWMLKVHSGIQYVPAYYKLHILANVVNRLSCLQTYRVLSTFRNFHPSENYGNVTNRQITTKHYAFKHQTTFLTIYVKTCYCALHVLECIQGIHLIRKCVVRQESNPWPWH